MIHVLSGKGKIVIEDKEIQLEKDDVILIDEGEYYYLEGNMRLGIPCSPAWTKEQHIETDTKPTNL